MNEGIRTNIPRRDRFESISDFEECMHYQGEVVFEYGSQSFSIGPTDDYQISIAEAFRQETERTCKDADEVLEYLIGGVHLRDIITQVDVIFRSV